MCVCVNHMNIVCIYVCSREYVCLHVFMCMCEYAVNVCMCQSTYMQDTLSQERVMAGGSPGARERHAPSRVAMKEVLAPPSSDVTGLAPGTSSDPDRQD